MSDVGIMLLLFVGVMCLVALIRFLAWLTDVKEEHGSLARAGIHIIQHYVSVRCLRSGVLSGSESAPAPPHFEPPSNHPASADAHQAEAADLNTNELIFELTKRSLNREQVLTLLARLRNPAGDTWFSANKISGIVGGTNAENMAIIAALRPQPKQAPPSHSPASVSRPKQGW